MEKNLSQSVKVVISEQIALLANFLLWTSFCFLKINQQAGVGMVSTNNIQKTYTDQIYNPFQ